jgi:hypothetical protein
MRKIAIWGVLALMALALAAVPALAASYVVDYGNAPSGTHLAKNSASEPFCTLDPATDTVSCTGATFGGVGNANVVSDLDIVASATVLCGAPGNRKTVEPHTTTAFGGGSDLATPTRNGQITIRTLSDTVTTSDVESQFACPNPNWHPTATDVTITSFTYTLTFVDAAGNPLFDGPFISQTGP